MKGKKGTSTCRGCGESYDLRKNAASGWTREFCWECRRLIDTFLREPLARELVAAVYTYFGEKERLSRLAGERNRYR